MGAPPDAQTVERWRRRYVAGLRRLRQRGIQTTADERTAAERYLSLRTEWDFKVASCPVLAYSMDVIDPAGVSPELTKHPPAVRQRLPTASRVGKLTV